MQPRAMDGKKKADQAQAQIAQVQQQKAKQQQDDKANFAAADVPGLVAKARSGGKAELEEVMAELGHLTPRAVERFKRTLLIEHERNRSDEEKKKIKTAAAALEDFKKYLDGVKKLAEAQREAAAKHSKDVKAIEAAHEKVEKAEKELKKLEAKQEAHREAIKEYDKTGDLAGYLMVDATAAGDQTLHAMAEDRWKDAVKSKNKEQGKLDKLAPKVKAAGDEVHAKKDDEAKARKTLDDKAAKGDKTATQGKKELEEAEFTEGRARALEKRYLEGAKKLAEMGFDGKFKEILERCEQLGVEKGNQGAIGPESKMALKSSIEEKPDSTDPKFGGQWRPEEHTANTKADDGGDAKPLPVPGYGGNPGVQVSAGGSVGKTASVQATQAGFMGMARETAYATVGVAGEGSAKAGTEGLELAGEATGRIGAGGKIEIASYPLEWELGGEKFVAQAVGAVDAFVGARAKLDASAFALSQRKGLLGVEANAAAFAGVEGGVSGKVSLDWNKKSVGAYAQEFGDERLMRIALVDKRVGRVSKSFWRKMADVLLPHVFSTQSGDVELFGVGAGVSGQLGVGAAAHAHAGVKDGTWGASASAGISLGAGWSMQTSFEVNPIDVASVVGIMAMRGLTALAKTLREKLGPYFAAAKDKIKKFCEAHFTGEHASDAKQVAGALDGHGDSDAAGADDNEPVQQAGAKGH